MNHILSYGAGCGVYPSIKNGMYDMYSLAQFALSDVHSSIIPPPNYTYPLKPPPPTYNPRSLTGQTNTKDIIYYDDDSHCHFVRGLRARNAISDSYEGFFV
jgi:hypothetical protein